jgi:hypothetical protein
MEIWSGSDGFLELFLLLVVEFFGLVDSFCLARELVE